MLRDWVWLTQRKGIGAETQRKLLHAFGSAEAVFAADEKAFSAALRLQPKQLSSLMRKDTAEAERVLRRCEEENIRLVTLQDQLYPPRLREIPDPPVLLYYQGTLPDFDAAPVVAIVGSRKASAYGQRQAGRFGYQLSAAGVIVVSGMARGIDSVGMEAALKGGSPVVGVLGCGIDRVYPPENGALYREVARHGCMISEYAPGTPPLSHHFPVRNRIISGLSHGVLVVEAAERSGALITASQALEQGRDVFAIPANLDVQTGRGSNALLRSGASLVSDAEDILREYDAQFPNRVRPASRQMPEPGTVPGDKKSVDFPQGRTYIDDDIVKSGLSADEVSAFGLLTSEPLVLDELLERSALPASRMLAALTLLELKGLVRQLPGKRYQTTES